ncbi:MAG TPA: radical SAM protein [Chondromyces sp.]|nr:radical SAM protein [Chondromyces sp.]
MSTFRDINARAWNECRLLSVLLELTHLCNYDCFFCYNDRIDRRAPLTLDEYSDLLQQLAEMAVLNLTLTGGEPVVRPDFFAIGGRARELGFVVRIKSNGHLIRGEVARRLKEEVAPYQVDLSLHGATAETHDRQTRRPGSFVRLLANIDEMKRLGLRVKLNCTVTSWNEHEIEAMFALADRLDLAYTFNASVSPRDDGDRHPLTVAPTARGMANLARYLETRRAANSPDDLDPESTPQAADGAPPVVRHCGAGSSSATIDQWGNVLPCVQWRREVGNIREAPFAEIWKGSAALAEVQRITIAAKDAARAFKGPRAVAFFCPGMAELLTGDPLAVYPAAPGGQDDALPGTPPVENQPHVPRLSESEPL